MNKMLYVVLSMIFLIVIILLVSCGVYRYIYVYRQQAKKEVEKQEREERVQNYRSEVEALLQEIEAVFSGEILIEDEENWMKMHNYIESHHPNVAEISVKVNVNDIRLMNDTGYIEADYWTIYKNEEGETISGGGHDVRWIIEKKEGRWVVIDGKVIRPYSE